MIKKGFTLAEVLITLSILGVVAALTIPGLIANTQGRQYSVGYKKAIATFGSAINKSVAMDGVDMSNWRTATRQDTGGLKYNNFTAFMRQNFNVQKVVGQNVYLADGTEFLGIGGLAAAGCTAVAPCVVTVDTNGDAGPNVQTDMVGTKPKVSDRFLMIITDVAALPAMRTVTDPDTGLTAAPSVIISGASVPTATQVQATNFAMTGRAN